MIKKSRFVLALALTLALGVAGVAFATGATENEASVEFKVKPTKLDKKKYKPISLFTGVFNQPAALPLSANPVSEYISYGKNIKFDFSAGTTCPALPPSGSTPDQAKDACPKDSFIGSGHATVQFPGLPLIDDVIVTAFRGPDKKGIQLHTYSPTLLAASPTVLGQVEKSNAGSKFGYALSVPNTPETGSGLITEFNATVSKSSKLVLGRCKSKTMISQRKSTYKDGSTDLSPLVSQKCKRK